MKTLEKIEKYILLTTVFLIPLFILPIFPNPFDTAKIALLATGIALALIVKMVKTIIKGSLEVASSPFDLPVALLAIAYLVSALVKTQSKMDAFFLPGTASIIIGGAILYFLINSSKAKEGSALGTTIFYSALATALVSLLAFSGLLAKISFLPAFVKDTAFTTLGGNLPAVIFFGVTILLGIGMILSRKVLTNKLFAGAATLIIVLAFIVNLLAVFPSKKTAPSLPSFSASWAVAIESLKESPLLGVGAGNYLTAFNRFRPVTYNNSKLWALRFTTGADFPISALTEAGLLGFAAFAILIVAAARLKIKILKSLKNKNLDYSYLSFVTTLMVSLAVLIVLPVSTPLLVLLFCFLSLATTTTANNINLMTFSPNASGSYSTNRILPFLIGIPVAAACIALLFFGGKALSAEYKFNQGLVALTKNDGKGTYELIRSAIALNPYVDRYHATSAQVNLALARIIAQKTTLTDQEKTTVAQLIQQAIAEGKATVLLNPSRAGNWDLLGRTYQSIMAFAQGADQFAITSYSQAVTLDPINPNLRLSLGGIYYALGRFDDAIKVFELAVLAKPDLPNARYNLALAYKEKGEIDNAITQMTLVLSLVDKNSQDYSVAKAELDNLEKNKPAKTTGTSETLTPPAKTVTPVIKPPLELPQDAVPPATQ